MAGRTVTTTETTNPQCPKCHATDSIDLEAGERLCLSCRNEWNPATVTVPEAETPAVGPPTRSLLGSVDETLHAATAAEVLSITPDDEAELATVTELHATPADLTGVFVRYATSDDDARTVLVIEDDGGDTIDVQDSEGHDFTVPRVHVSLVGTEPSEPGYDALGVDPNEPLPQTILAVAGLTLTVALAAVPDGEHEPGIVNNPRIGWLPPPCDQVPEAECGVAYACALLISIFGLDKQEVARLAANLITGAESGTETETEQ